MPIRLLFPSGLLLVAALTATAAWWAARSASAQAAPDGDRIAVTFSGGYQTDRRDGGRPVVLIAAALGVTSDKFREAFSGVTPARGGPPEPAQVRRNKEALMRVLGPLGITNDRLDEVSNFYRYRPQEGELWRHTPAKAYATVHNGKITGFVVTEPGAGYSSPPTVTVPGDAGNGLAARVTLSFGKDLKTNGSIREIALDAPATRPQEKQ
jgi:hypothetical protein